MSKKDKTTYRVILVDFENLEAVEGEIIFDGLTLGQAREKARELMIEGKDKLLVSIEEMKEVPSDTK
jgi:hypothetical protein